MSHKKTCTLANTERILNDTKDIEYDITSILKIIIDTNNRTKHIEKMIQEINDAID